MPGESLSFDIFANDRASETFRRLGLAADNASGDVRKLGDRLDKIGSRVAQARVGVDDKEANADLDKFDVKLIKLGKKVANPNLDVEGKIKALADIAAVDVALDKFGRKHETATIATRISGLANAGFFAPSLGGAALALSPSLIPLAAGVAAGIGAITVSFAAATVGAGLFGLAAASVLSSASSNLQKLQALEATRNKATTAAQKKSADAAIAALKATFAKGYMTLLDQLDTFKGAWTKSSQTIAVPALTSWLKTLTAGMPLLVTAVKPVADVFQNFADILRADFNNPVIMKRLQDMAAAFGRFSAGQLNLVGRAIGDMALGVYHLGHDFAASGTNFANAGVWFANMGTAFLNWSKSDKARKDVQGFMKFLHDEAPVVTGILRDLGKALPGIFAGATTVGTLELQALGDFMSLVAKLPKNWQKGLTEFAGTMLLLSKIGVVKVGIKLVGLDALGAGAGVAGPSGAAGAAMAAGVVLKFKEDLQSGFKRAIPALGRDLGNVFSGLGGFASTGAAGLADTINAHFSGAVRRIFSRAWHDIADGFDSFRHSMAIRLGFFGDMISAAFAVIRHDIATTWDRIWSNTVATVRGGVGDVVGWFQKLPSRAIGALWGLGHQLYAFARAALGDFLSGMKSIAGSVFSWVGNFVANIWDKVKRFFGQSPPHPGSKFYELGAGMMLHLEAGIKSHAHRAAAAATAAAHRVASAGSGVQRWAGLVREALSMEGLSPSLAGNVLYQMNTESGGNPNAINLNDINARMGDPSRGLMQTIMSTFDAYHWPGTSWNIYNPLANIAAALNYARHVYGPSLMSGGMGIGSGHGYAAGSWNVPRTGPALIHKGEMVIPAQAAAGIRRGGGGTVNNYVTVQVGHGTHPVAAAQEIARLLNTGARSGVRLRTSILGPG